MFYYAILYTLLYLYSINDLVLFSIYILKFFEDRVHVLLIVMLSRIIKKLKLNSSLNPCHSRQEGLPVSFLLLPSYHQSTHCFFTETPSFQLEQPFHFLQLCPICTTLGCGKHRHWAFLGQGFLVTPASSSQRSCQLPVDLSSPWMGLGPHSSYLSQKTRFSVLPIQGL